MTQRSGVGDRSAVEMDRRLTTMEQQLLNMGVTLDRHMTRTDAALAHLDSRQDRADIFAARLIGGLVVAQFLAILFAPVIRSALGLPGQ